MSREQTTAVEGNMRVVGLRALEGEIPPQGTLWREDSVDLLKVAGMRASSRYVQRIRSRESALNYFESGFLRWSGHPSTLGLVYSPSLEIPRTSVVLPAIRQGWPMWPSLLMVTLSEKLEEVSKRTSSQLTCT